MRLKDNRRKDDRLNRERLKDDRRRDDRLNRERLKDDRRRDNRRVSMGLFDINFICFIFVNNLK